MTIGGWFAIGFGVTALVNGFTIAARRRWAASSAAGSGSPANPLAPPPLRPEPSPGDLQLAALRSALSQPLRMRAVPPAGTAVGARPAQPAVTPLPSAAAPPAALVASPPSTRVPRKDWLASALGDPASARTAVVLSEVLAPPKALR